MWGRVADTWGWEDHRVQGVGEELVILGCFSRSRVGGGIGSIPGLHVGAGGWSLRGQ